MFKAFNLIDLHKRSLCKSCRSVSALSSQRNRIEFSFYYHSNTTGYDRLRACVRVRVSAHVSL